MLSIIGKNLGVALIVGVISAGLAAKVMKTGPGVRLESLTLTQENTYPAPQLMIGALTSSNLTHDKQTYDNQTHDNTVDANIAFAGLRVSAESMAPRLIPQPKLKLELARRE